MAAAGVFDLLQLARLEAGEIGKVVFPRAGNALAGIRHVPLLVIVEDDRDDVVEIDDEAVAR